MKERKRKQLIDLYHKLDRVRDQINKAAIKAYGIHPKQIFNPREEKFKDFLSPDDVVLDLGCGNGKTLKALAEVCQGGIGIEWNDRNFKIATTKFRSDKVKVIKGDIIQELQNLDQDYTIALMAHVLEHIQYPVDILRQIKSNKLIILVPANTWEYMLREDLGMRATREHDHFKEYDKQILTSELTQAGWSSKYMEFTEEEELLCYAEREAK